LNNTAANTYSGGTTFSGVNLVVQGPASLGTSTTPVTLSVPANLPFASNLTVTGAGTVTSTGGFVVNPGATLRVDDSSVASTDRIGNTATLTLNGGSFV